MPTAPLRSNASGEIIEQQVRLVGNRGPGGTADGLLAMADGSIYMGLNGDPHVALGVWSGKGNPSEAKALVPSRWVDTFGFDEKEKMLYWTENSLDLFFSDTMDFGGSSG